ncbi:hypothetical protein [Shewanella sp. SG41-3]|uniref:hypothetical protein n=1 Tax=Shewanella sp. SG41-3 TaxID=2760977 RepID=UPI0016015BC0|nr:hypothetical protein [Shewanella sp. SG41-3]MBB1477568.1 hypothetical protein [Shewanella sp. SG41-3]
MASDIMIIVSSVVTGLFTLSAVFLTNKINSSNSEKLLAQANHIDRNKSKLLKLEELYIKFDKWSGSFNNVCFKYLHLVGTLDNTEILEAVLDGNSNVKNDFIELKMLVSIYFPEHENALSLVFESRDKCANYFGHVERCHDLEAAMKQFGIKSESFKKSIGNLAKSL